MDGTKEPSAAVDVSEAAAIEEIPHPDDRAPDDLSSDDESNDDDGTEDIKQFLQVWRMGAWRCLAACLALSLSSSSAVLLALLLRPRCSCLPRLVPTCLYKSP